MRRNVHVVLATAIVLTACGGDDDAGGNATSEPPDATTASVAQCPTADDRTLDVATYVEPLGLDPLVASGGSYGGLEVAAIYDTLMRWDPDAGDYEPWVAESLEPNEDFRAWTLTLRDGVTFGNGDSLTAEVVKASIARHQDPENRSNLGNLVAPITKMEVTGETTMVFHLDGPWPGFPFALANTPGMITNPSVVKERGADLNADPSGAGVGPYDVVRNAPGEELVLEARSDYWGGEVCIPELRFVRISGAQATYDSLRHGDIDVAFLRDPRVLAAARQEDLEEQSWIMNLGELLLVNHGVQQSKPVTTDVRIRQAVAAAIDTTAVDQRVNEGNGLPTSAIAAADSGLDISVAGPEFDPERAEALLAEAKADGWDGHIRLACDNAPNRQDIALSVAAQLEAVGFVVELDNTSTINGLVEKVFNADYDLACWGINVHAAGVWAKLDKQLGGASASNFAGFKDDAWDAALAELRAAATPGDVTAALDALQTRWNEVIPVVDLAAVEEAIIWQPDVRGLTPSAESLLLFGDARIEGE